MITSEDIQLSKMSYTDKDFASLYPDLLDLAKQLTNKWDPSLSNESDPGVVLLKEGAFIADHNNYNIDKNVLENFLPSATQDKSVRDIVEMNGYNPRYYISAIGDINFTYNGTSTGNNDNFYGFTIPAFSIVVTNEEGTVAYTQLDDLRIDEIGLNKPCRFIQGTLNVLKVNNEDRILKENLTENNRIYLPDPYVAENGIFIRNIAASTTANKETVDRNYWVKNDYLLTQPLGSKIYRVDYDSSMNLPYIEFPSDISSIIGNGLEIRYISTVGINGNIGANKLTKIASPSTFRVDSNTKIEMADFSVSNSSAIQNGKNPETIDEMYNSFKRIVGTFDTLVTCRDYANAIYELKDENNQNYISNVQVTDRRTDYNNALNVVTFDENGEYFKNISLNVVDSGRGISRYRFVTDVGASYTPALGDIKFTENGFKCCVNIVNSEPVWQTITDLSYTDFVEAVEKMNPYDLCIYALKAFSMTDYSVDRPSNALNNSFLPADNSTLRIIRKNLEDLKCINHTFKDLYSNDIFCFKNYVPINATITPYSKITKTEKEEILVSINRALVEAFNARELEFGEELSYDKVYDVILNSDERIKSITLADFEYTPKVMFADGREQELYYSTELLVDLIAKNVLAGRLCLFNFDEEFKYLYGQNNVVEDDEIISISTDLEIDVEPEPDSSVDVVNKEDTEIIGFDNVDAEQGLIELKLYTSQETLKDEFYLSPNTIYELQDGEAITVTSNGTRTSYGPNTDTVKYSIANIISGDIRINDPDTNYKLQQNSFAIRETTKVSETSGSIDLSYSPKKNEYILIAYPNYYSTTIYPTYCFYRFESNNTLETDNKVVAYANTDYTLKAGEKLDISFKKDDTEQVKQYTAGTVIRTTFDLIPTDYTTTTKVNKRYMVNGMISSDTKKFNSLSANQQIAIREQLSTSLTGSNTPCYWIKNGNTNTLFKEGENWVILDSGEYFIFSDTTKSSMTILGAGTKLIRGTGDTSNWSIPNRSSNIESINNLGYSANIKWEYKDFSAQDCNFTIQEMNVVTIGEGSNITVYNWDNKPQTISGSWQPCTGTIRCEINGEETILRKLDTEDGYLIRTRLDIMADSDTGQELVSSNNSRQSVTIVYSGSDEKVISSHDPESGEPDTDPVNIKTSIPIDLVGGSDIDITPIIETGYSLNLLEYSIRNPLFYGVDYELCEGRINDYPEGDANRELLGPPYLSYDPAEGAIDPSYLGETAVFMMKTAGGGQYAFEVTGKWIYELKKKIIEEGGLTYPDIPSNVDENSYGWLTYKILYEAGIPNMYLYKDPSDPDSYLSPVKLALQDEKYYVNLNTVGRVEFPFSYNVEVNLNTFIPSREYILPVFLSGNSNSFKDVKAKIEIISDDTDPKYINNITCNISDYNRTTPSESIILNKNEMYLLKPDIVIETNNESNEVITDEVITLNLKLVLSWDELPTSSETLVVYQPNVVSGLNDEFVKDVNVSSSLNSISLGSVLNRIDYLISHSSNPNIKPYYIHRPELSMEIQDEDISNPYILWDKNNVANIITIPQIDLDNSNIDITKSMRIYSSNGRKDW